MNSARHGHCIESSAAPDLDAKARFAWIFGSLVRDLQQKCEEIGMGGSTGILQGRSVLRIGRMNSRQQRLQVSLRTLIPQSAFADFALLLQRLEPPERTVRPCGFLAATGNCGMDGESVCDAARDLTGGDDCRECNLSKLAVHGRRRPDVRRPMWTDLC